MEFVTFSCVGDVAAGRTAEPKSHTHDHGHSHEHSHHHEHGHTHEAMESPGSYTERDPPVYRTDWKKVIVTSVQTPADDDQSD